MFGWLWKNVFGGEDLEKKPKDVSTDQRGHAVPKSTLVPSATETGATLSSGTPVVSPPRSRKRKTSVKDPQTSLTKKRMSESQSSSGGKKARTLISSPARKPSKSDPVSEAWEANFAKVRELFELHHSLENFSAHCKDDTLVSWVEDQQKQYENDRANSSFKKSFVARNQFVRLVDIGAIQLLSPRQDVTIDRDFDVMLGKLAAFNETHKDALVPPQFEDQELAKWVKSLRSKWGRLRRGTSSNFSVHQMEKLNAIGFEFTCSRGRPRDFTKKE
jgi:hypothetical protein